MPILCTWMMLGHCISHTNTKYVTYDTLNALTDSSIHALCILLAARPPPLLMLSDTSTIP